MKWIFCALLSVSELFQGCFAQSISQGSQDGGIFLTRLIAGKIQGLLDVNPLLFENILNEISGVLISSEESTQIPAPFAHTNGVPIQDILEKRGQPEVLPLGFITEEKRKEPLNTEKESNLGRLDVVFIIIISLSAACGVFGLVIAAYWFKKLRKRCSSAKSTPYESKSASSPSHLCPVDSLRLNKRRLTNETQNADSVDQNDFNVYECPGLASQKNMEVDNPLFQVNTPPNEDSFLSARDKTDSEDDEPCRYCEREKEKCAPEKDPERTT